MKEGWGGFEDYPELPVLSLRGEEEMPTQNRAERGKKRAEEQESSTTKLFSLLIEMREDIKRRENSSRKN